MVDMLYVDRAGYSEGLTLYIHYNRLQNADREKDKNKIESAFSVIAQVCSDVGRPVVTLDDIFLPMSMVANSINAEGIPNTDRVVRVQLYPEELGVQGIYSPDSTHMPGRVTIGDVSSDGFPDIILTVKYQNDTTGAHLLLNSPCTKRSCSLSARDVRRRTFVHSQQGANKFLLDDEDLGDSVANDIFEGRFTNLNMGDKKEYDITGEEYGETLGLFNNVKYATFFDLLEDNMIDILLVTDNGNGRQIKAIYNNID